MKRASQDDFVVTVPTIAIFFTVVPSHESPEPASMIIQSSLENLDQEKGR